MTRLGRTCATLVAAVSLTACAGNSVQDAPSAPQRAAARVQVQNNNWSDMTVVLEKAGRRLRLGTVTSMSSRLLRIPGNFLAGSGAVRVVLDPLGGSAAYSSHAVELWPGQVMDLTIQNHVGISSISVWEE